jgi:hypothetical protein
MIDGVWRITHQGLAFNAAGFFTDGQNRCNGVIDSGVEIDTLVFFGVGDREEMAVMDCGGVRTPLDASRVLEIRADKTDLATMRIYLQMNRKSTGTYLCISNRRILSELEAHAEQLAKVSEWFSCAKIRGTDRAAIRATVLAALLHGADEGRLRTFAHVLTDKAQPSRDHDGAKVLQRYLVNNKPQNGAAGTIDLFLRCCNALNHYLAGEPVKQIKAGAENPFLNLGGNILDAA